MRRLRLLFTASVAEASRAVAALPPSMAGVRGGVGPGTSGTLAIWRTVRGIAPLLPNRWSARPGVRDLGPAPGLPLARWADLLRCSLVSLAARRRRWL